MSLPHTTLLILATLACSLSLDVPDAPASPAATATPAATARKHDDFAALEHHLTQTLAHHYLWPWRQLFEAAAALDAQETLEEPQIISTPDKFQVNMSVKRFNPDDLRVKVKNRHMVVEGKLRSSGDSHRFAINHFVQRFVLPPGSKQEEVTAVLENKVLRITVPKHEVPPPPPEREVPIVVVKPAEVSTSSKPDISSEQPETSTVTITSANSSEASVQPAAVPVTGAGSEQLELSENTTHVGKIRKKELKTAVKSTKDNEVDKGLDGNGLDYVLIDTE